MKRVLFVVLILAAIGGLQIAGCKEGEGQRCQVTADCEDLLICNKAKGICENQSQGGEIDAPFPIDAPIDMPTPTDTPTDMPPD